MLAKNVFNPEKQGQIQGSVFHLFYMDLNTAILFDKDLSKPIMWGSKTVVMNALKHIDRQMNIPDTSKVVIYSYILDTQGYRRIQTFNGAINTIGKYIIRY